MQKINFEELGFSKEYVETVRKTVAKGANDEELKMFLYLAKKYDLDPFLREIWCFSRPKKQRQPDGSWDYPRTPDGSIDYKNSDSVIMSSRDGYLKVARRHPEYVGPPLSFAIREGDEFEIDANKHQVTHKFGAKRGKIIGAWAKVDRKNKTPAIWVADFNEYYNDNNKIWKKYKTAMICKVAEVFVLKRQFGIDGLVTHEELSLSDEEGCLYDNVEDKVAEQQSEPSTAKANTAEPDTVEAGTKQTEETQESEPQETSESTAKEVKGDDKTDKAKEVTVKLGKRANYIKHNDTGFRTAQFQDGKIGWVMGKEPIAEALSKLEPVKPITMMGAFLEGDQQLPEGISGEYIFKTTDIKVV